MKPRMAGALTPDGSLLAREGNYWVAGQREA